MATLPKFRLYLTDEGTVRMVDTTGEPITEAQVEWMRGILRDALRVEAIKQSATHKRAQELAERDDRTKGTTRGGVRFDIDPIIDQLEQERKFQGISRSALSRVVTMPASNSSRLGEYVRGAARPQMDTLRAWAGLLGWVFMIVPRELREQIEKLIVDWQTRRTVDVSKHEVAVE